MNRYLITYQLATCDCLTAIHKKIQSYELCCYVSNNTYMVNTTKTAISIRDEIQEIIGKKDKVYVLGLTGEGAWVSHNDQKTKRIKIILRSDAECYLESPDSYELK